MTTSQLWLDNSSIINSSNNSIGVIFCSINGNTTVVRPINESYLSPSFFFLFNQLLHQSLRNRSAAPNEVPLMIHYLRSLLVMFSSTTLTTVSSNLVCSASCFVFLKFFVSIYRASLLYCWHVCIFFR